MKDSRRPWLLRLLPEEPLGDRLYAWIGRRRGALGSAGRMTFGHNASTGIGVVGRVVAAFALLLVLAWNLATYPAVRDWKDFRGLIEPAIGMLNLTQYWDMFAPYPYLSDFWHVMPALARDGREVDLLSGLPVRLEPPVDGPDHYGGYRWRKTIYRSLQRDEIDRVFRYHCLTGAWAAIDLWEFSRPNLGTAATGDGQYRVHRMGRWYCDDVNGDIVDLFQSRVDGMMNDYRRESRNR